jgi:pimeloyl-ACP methyl ester carboxylesterase
MEPREGTVRLDGRELAFLEDGDLGGYPVFYHHGTPSSALLYRAWVEDARRQGVRLIGYDRPGYGGSTRHPGRAVADAAGDVAAIADHLGLERFATWGISGGGPHALACAALMPERVVAAATLASVGPGDATDLDFVADMGDDNVREFGAALQGEDELRPLLEEWRPDILGGTPEGLVESMRSVLTEVDVGVLSGEAAGYFVAEMGRALRTGVEGWLDDDLAFTRSWGFRLDPIAVPVLLWQGRQDLMVPWAHGEWLAARIPGVEARFEPEEGHLSLLLTRVGDTHAWLLEHA